MKTNKPANDDQALRGLLREWTVEAPLPSRFREQVWRRIENEAAQPVAMASTWMLLRAWVAILLPRPALAVAYVAVLLVAGAGVGWAQAQHQTSRVNGQLSQRYLQSVDPFQALP
jgi:hypothetical protein